MNAAANLNLVVPHSRVNQTNSSSSSSNNNNNNSNTNNGNTNSNATSAVASTNTTTISSSSNNNNTITNGSLSDSLASTEGHRTPNVEHLSKTNLYIRGLQSNTSDQDLLNMCIRYGQISSTKAILDKATGCCRGYGFVEFTAPQSAELAVQELTKSGIQAQMAKISPLYSSHQHQQHHHHNHHHHANNNSANNNNNNNSQQHNQNSTNNNNADPTNLYIANLPPNMSEQELENLLSKYGPVVSTRILRDQSNIPRGVGFARMESRDKCEQIIEQLNGRPCAGWKEPLLVKFADGGNKKRHHNQHQHQHHNNNHHQHHKVLQDDSRWRDGSNMSDLGSASSFDHQGNISHSNHLSDLAMMSTLSYPRMQHGFPPTMAAGAYPAPLGPPTSAPQWIHPGGPGQPYVIPQQIIQAGGLGPSNQAAAAAALHYGHIPQLTSQMQGLQIAHPGAPVGGYLPPQHQWSALWTHPIPQQPQPSMRLPTPLQPPPQTSQPQQPLQQQHQSSQSTSMPLPHHHHHPQQQLQQPPTQQQQQQQQIPPQQQSMTADNKLQVSMPL